MGEGGPKLGDWKFSAWLAWRSFWPNFVCLSPKSIYSKKNWRYHFIPFLSILRVVEAAVLQTRSLVCTYIVCTVGWSLMYTVQSPKWTFLFRCFAFKTKHLFFLATIIWIYFPCKPKLLLVFRFKGTVQRHFQSLFFVENCLSGLRMNRLKLK